jgi:hypothetical protein
MTSNAEKPNFFLYHDTGNPLCEEHSVLAPQHYVRKFHNLDSLFYKHIEHFGDFFWNASKEFGEKWAPVEKSAQEGYVGIKVVERRLFESILDFSVDDQESEVAYG